jgi:hypothetical protein
MSKSLSAVDAIGPAFEWTKRQLFAPFRFERWARLAVVCLMTGDFATGGGTSGGGYHPQIPRSRRWDSPFGFLSPEWATLHNFLPLIVAGVLLLLILILVWIYVASVYRFVLFDSVLYDRCELKGAWRRWEPYGRSYFGWCLSLFLGVWAGLLVVVGVPALLAWHAGWFAPASAHLAQLIGAGVLVLLLVILLFIGSGVAGLFAKDFCVPVMALEDLRVTEAWRRLLPMLQREKLAYLGYVLMKIVLAVGCAIIFGIAMLLALVAVAIPLVVVGVVLFLVAKGAGLGWNPATFSVVVLLGGMVVLGLFYLLALVSTPAMVFFQAYALNYFGGRYAPLGAVVSAPPAPQQG